MTEKFQFLSPGSLVDGDLRLVLVKKHPAIPEKGLVPWYQFEMRRAGSKTKVGRISFRVGPSRVLRYPGQIGYRVDKRYRGQRYAARACRLLFEFIHRHGFKSVWITCSPVNKASVRTLELVGGMHVDTVRVPVMHQMYRNGIRYVRRYRIDLKNELRKRRRR